MSHQKQTPRFHENLGVTKAPTIERHLGLCRRLLQHSLQRLAIITPIEKGGPQPD
jgi:hypothetical protein